MNQRSRRRAIVEMIAALGGNEAVACALGVRESAVRQWVTRTRIPPRHAATIEALSKGLYTAQNVLALR